MTTLDVSNGVAASFSAGHPDEGDVAKKFRYPFELDEMELDGLACGEVTPTTGILGGQIAHAIELRSSNGAVRRLDADHLVVSALALAIDAVVQAKDAKDVLFEFARKVPGELDFKLCDIGSRGCVDLEIRHVGALLHP
jgi:hypothetical protein